MSEPAARVLERADGLERAGRVAEAEEAYRALVEADPAHAVARFNYACFLRRRGRLEEALESHRAALERGIDEPEEVLVNMAVIEAERRRDEASRALLERALATRPDYVPALYNLGLQHEEFGRRPEAIALFRRILEIDPGYHHALVRIAYAERVRDPDSEVIRRLQRALRRAHVDPLARESLHFALGKAWDDCARHELAFAQYELGNRLSARRLRPYDRGTAEAQVRAIEASFTAEWLAGVEPVSDRPLVFVTGHFRSGSTLAEQLIAGDPRVAAGGEIGYFARAAQPFPDSVAGGDAAALGKIGRGYLDYLERTFPPGAIVTNKRPDSFAWLGLIRALFPGARFVHTVRDPRDTCLSIWFQQLDGSVAYAASLPDIAHHWRLGARLMAHWRGLFGESILDLDYDRLAADPAAEVEALYRFLGLEWRPERLDVAGRGNRVRTASVWQVREPIHGRSSGRWRRYEPWIGPLLAELGDAVD